MFGYFGIIIVVTALIRLAGYLFHLRPFAYPQPVPTLRLLLKQHISTPALFRKRVAQPSIAGTVPTRIQFLTLIAFVVINFVLCCVHHDIFVGNI